MKKFASELAAFLRRYYPETKADGWYRFSADIQLRNGNVEVEIPVLTRLPDATRVTLSNLRGTSDPLDKYLPHDAAD
jgi:hypothetical protein